MHIGLRIVGAALLLAAGTGVAAAQSGATAPVVTQPESSALSPQLSDLPVAHWVQTPQGLKEVPPPRPMRPHAAGPGGADVGGAEVQRAPGADAGVKPKVNFGGIGASGYIPPDANIAVGTTYIVQVVNSQIAVFNKSGGLVSGPVALSSLWSALGGNCAANNAGDPVVQYDLLADRWLVSQLGSTNGPTYSECIAVSQTNDPRGAYYMYSYPFGSTLNDYPKFGVWPTATSSAYLASYNLFSNGQSFAGAALCAYDRNAMLGGAASPAQICFTVANDGGFLPSDLDGATPPGAGAPGYFLNFETLSSLRLYQLSANFAAQPPTATLTQTPDIAVASFSEACGGGTCIPQPNNQKLDSLGDRLMYRLAYRVFSDHAAMVVNHSVVAGSSVGVRWYELRQPTGGTFSLYQQGTFAPDSAYRWMGSAAMDGAGNIAIGYSKSSGSIYPAIAFTGRTPQMPTGTMGAETVLQAGSGAQTTYSRWGDYTALRIDPSDDSTFWYTNEYYNHNSMFFNYVWSTAIGSFKIAGVTAPPDFALSVSPGSLAVTRGGASASATVSVTAINGGSSVSLSLSGLPKGASASFSPNPVTATTGGASATLTIGANRSASRGTFGITITGNNGSASHAIPLMLTVN